ncbi:hypothetical protein KIP88_25185 [Bradyrhizobium sp. SRL28]|uniref:hypothetical protein n=1 Tax=Bradyrhizobium sp. SRL28 TaxID=2836178 RepID=UPI001BDF07FA|nr:hypothetical protein [Bradyrhizobium sp. SRL28]MBT1513790.1 hypothetical protein [Bradyrhizobium sp. SRL28]
MPTPADIIDVISTRLSFPKKTVAQQDRLLVINGQRKISGRGRSAMASPRDAAALLIAVAATPISGPAINIANYQSYANLHAVHLPQGKLESWRNIVSLRDLPDGHTLLEALSRIITCLSKGALLADGNGLMTPQREYPHHINVHVDLYAPVSRATVTIERTTENSSEPEFAEALHYFRTIDDGEPIVPLDVQIDFAQTRSFGIRTLWSLAQLFDVGAQSK